MNVNIMVEMFGYDYWNKVNMMKYYMMVNIPYEIESHINNHLSTYMRDKNITVLNE